VGTARKTPRIKKKTLKCGEKIGIQNFLLVPFKGVCACALKPVLLVVGELWGVSQLF
jgi:hypothetical protein